MNCFNTDLDLQKPCQQRTWLNATAAQVPERSVALAVAEQVVPPANHTSAASVREAEKWTAHPVMVQGKRTTEEGLA